MSRNSPVAPLDDAHQPGRRRVLLAAAGLLAASTLAKAKAAPAVPALRAQRLAWAGVRLQLGADAVFLDPLLNADVWGPALHDAWVPVDAGPGQRYVLVSHRHPDHFDLGAIRQALGNEGLLLGTPDVVSAATAAGIRARAPALYEPVLLGDFTATAVPASDGYGDPQVSWVVSGGGRRIIHCGDTMWHGAWWHMGRQLGPFDAAFLPINGARFSWRQPVSDIPAVLTPEQAVAAAVVLGARQIVPIHYGVQGAEGYAEIPQARKVLEDAAGKRNLKVATLQSGDWLDWQS